MEDELQEPPDPAADTESYAEQEINVVISKTRRGRKRGRRKQWERGDEEEEEEDEGESKDLKDVHILKSILRRGIVPSLKHSARSKHNSGVNGPVVRVQPRPRVPQHHPHLRPVPTNVHYAANISRASFRSTRYLSFTMCAALQVIPRTSSWRSDSVRLSGLRQTVHETIGSEATYSTTHGCQVCV
ncbi:hypothetical protein WDU94_000319 [Cyamophila willieti]